LGLSYPSIVSEIHIILLLEKIILYSATDGQLGFKGLCTILIVVSLFRLSSSCYSIKIPSWETAKAYRDHVRFLRLVAQRMRYALFVSLAINY